MLIKKKYFIVLIVSLIFCLAINSVASASFYVNNDTTHKQITDWIDNKAIKGDKLIFNSSNYELSDTIVVNKPIIVGSYKNTVINFNKSKNMFNLTANATNFVGLTLNHNGKNIKDYYFDPYSYLSVLYSEKSYLDNLPKYNLKNMVINTNVAYGISFLGFQGNIINCVFNTKNSTAIFLYSWKGNLINSKITSGENAIKGDYHYGLDWKGYISKSNIKSKYVAIGCYSWEGIIYKSNIYSYESSAINLGISKGTIKDNVIRSKYTAIFASPTVKFTRNKLIAGKRYSKIHWYKPDLSLEFNKKIKNTYHITITNWGKATSPPCYLGFKYGKTIKKVPVKSLTSENNAIVKITIPNKYATSKYTKTLKIDYYNKIKEENEKDNIVKISL